MEMNQYFETEKLRFELILKSKSLLTHSLMGDLTMDTKADIRQVLLQTAKTIVQIIEMNNRR